MATGLDRTYFSDLLRWQGFDYWPIYLGLMILYIPTFFSLNAGVWMEGRNAQGPLILAAVVWVLWRERNAFEEVEAEPRPRVGWLVFSAGLLLYILGRSQSILFVEVGSQIPVIAGLLLLLKGAGLVQRLQFMLLFLVFLIPLPGMLIDRLTGPLKHQVSVIVDQLLYWFGYPIALSGVVLSIGPYQMLIADACSGLNSMYSLTVLGVLYIYVRWHVSRIQNVLLLLFVLPIAFIANIGRVIALLLITYHFGDEAGRGFLHDFAGMTEFVLALLVLMIVDLLMSPLFLEMET
ncbi:MAG: exosortase B [Candidatus Thiodiazotropha sp. (ex Ustalcina ferruginea)]|nr:exosortase B [Candidatus Thiodiazotropha sp. (ex Ustalcina ferruginea)]